VWGAYTELLNIVEEPFSILDAGCMSGFLYHHLLRHCENFTYTGMDKWPEALQVGREYAGVEFILGDVLNPQFERRENGNTIHRVFDYVWCCNLPWRNDDEGRAVTALMPLASRALIFVCTPGNGKPWKHMPGCEIVDCGESTLCIARKPNGAN
jgi:SAM-dependent methyltransferase